MASKIRRPLQGVTMCIKCSRFVMFTIVMLSPLTARSQLARVLADSLVDVFPLAIGNQWTYHYYTLIVNWPAGNPGTDTADSGKVTYRVSGSTAYADSTAWHFQVERDMMHHFVSYHPLVDTTYPIQDSSSFDLIEGRDGQHQLYRNADPYSIRLDVFPFTIKYVDSTSVFRYRTVDQGDTTIFQSWISPALSSEFKSTFTFRMGVGLIRNSYNSGTIDAFQINEHSLLNSITGIEQGVSSTKPSSVYLYQNYPNPFNPSTTIPYFIPSMGHVTLKVFDLLGQEVATLVDEVGRPGNNVVRWNASDLANGVYFSQLTSGSALITRKMLLVK